MQTDPISDYLTRIRNAIRARHKKVDIPTSNLKRELTKLLLEQKYITRFSEAQDGVQGTLRIFLKYQGTESVIRRLIRVSKPGLRVYVDHDKLPRVLDGLGIAVISTSRGLMTEKDARRQKLGGEVLCYVW
ncbi:MAG: 30S ribosomal protein S8 [Bacteroidota bacterium]|jgi:small subunit ribosomal protein S8